MRLFGSIFGNRHDHAASSHALLRYNAGAYKEAAELARKTLSAGPDVEADYVMGAILFRSGRIVDALPYLASASKAIPGNARFRTDLARALSGCGRYAEAEEAAIGAVQLKPDADIVWPAVEILLARGKYGEAGKMAARAAGDERCRNVAAALALLQPEDVPPDVRDLSETHFEQGLLAFRDSDARLAYDHVLKALAAWPTSIEAYVFMADVLHIQGKYDTAVATIETAIRNAEQLGFFHEPAWLIYGEILLTQHKTAEACEIFTNLVHRGMVEAMLDLALKHSKTGQLDDARQLLHRAHQAAPLTDLPLSQLASICLNYGDRNEAIDLARGVIREFPDSKSAYMTLGAALLGQGKFREGFEHFTQRLRIIDLKAYRPARHEPDWKGDDLTGKTLLVYYEQGLGDTIQFARFAPLLATRCGHLLLSVKDELKSLFQCLPGVEIISAAAALTVPCDYVVSLLDLPYFLGAGDAVPLWSGPYLRSPREAAADAPDLDRHYGKLRIGLTWQGSKFFWNTLNRDMQPVDLVPLGDLPGMEFINLQKDSAGAFAGMIDPPKLDDFADTATIIADLDLVISVDTSVAHLAGAMGKPVWLLLPHKRDWRWPEDGYTTPWYPTMRIFSQTSMGDWGQVITDVADALRNHAISNRA